jgi:haloalkane dehalogenase
MSCPHSIAGLPRTRPAVSALLAATVLLATAGHLAGEEIPFRPNADTLRPDALRTPDARFADLADFPFRPHYAFVDGLRIHYLDEGGRDAPVVLLLHGEPTWSYLYRSMIPDLVRAGFRVVAPDLVGFGRSDKLRDPGAYSYAAHVSWMGALLFDELDLDNVNLFVQDWGGLIGLRLVADHPERFARVAAANTGLPSHESEGELSEAFLDWLAFSQNVPEFPAGGVVQMGSVRDLPEEVISAYDAPFPDEAYKAGARVFPSLVPRSADDPEARVNRQAWRALERFDRPFLTLFSDRDPVTAGWDRPMREGIPGARGQPHRTIRGAGHFLQEDAPADLLDALIPFFRGEAPRVDGARTPSGISD